MVTACAFSRRQASSALIAELVVAMTLLVVALLPIAFSTASEQRLARSYYHRAVALEIVDGEMEALLAGGWRAFAPGTREYPIHAGAAVNLPPGRFLLTVAAHQLRLEWRPAAIHNGGAIVREAAIP